MDAVAQTTKHGYVFVFERETGKPLFPIDYRPFPASDVEGERAADTQPIPSCPKPFARQLLTRDLLTTRTPQAHAWALEAFAAFRSAGQFVPLAVGRDTVVFPGFDGGAEWGGSAFDAATALLYVNANDLAWTGALAPADEGLGGRARYLKECAVCHRDDLKGTPPQIPALTGLGRKRTRAKVEQVIRQGAGRMPGFPSLSQEAVTAVAVFVLTGKDAAPAPPAPVQGQGATAHGGGPPMQADVPTAFPRSTYRFTGYKKFLDPDGYPAVAPPWGTLSAIDLNTGDYAWQVPLGEYPSWRRPA